MNRSVIGFLCFVVAIIIAITFVWPKANDVRSAGVNERAELGLSNNLQTKLASLNALSQTFAANTSRVNALVSVLPQTPQIPESLVSIEAMAQGAGIDVASLTPQIDTNSQQVTVTLTGSGDIDSVTHLLNSVADNDRPISVGAISMVRSADGKKINVTIALNFPYRVAKGSGS